MFLSKVRKRTFYPPSNLKYDWVGTIYRSNKVYRVHRTEARINLPNGKNMPTVIFKLMSDKDKVDYVLIGREDSLSNYWSSVQEEVLIILENEFLPKYNK